jgi:two-component system sensor histidine kinase SaeS
MDVNRFLPPGLFRRMTLSHLMVGLLSVLVMATLAINAIMQNGLRELEHSLEDYAFSISNMLEVTLDEYASGKTSVENIQINIERYLSSRPDVEFTIIGKQNQILLTTEDPDVLNEFIAESVEYQQALNGGEGEALIRSNTGLQYFFVAVPVTVHNQTNGVLRLSIPVKSNMAHAYSTVWLILIGAGLLLIGVVLIGWVSAKTLVTPISNLTDVAERFSRGELDARAEPQGPLEFVRLAHAFNQMAERLQNNMDNLRGFVVNASHELRTPLTAIRLNLDALQQGALDEPEVAKKFLTKTQEEIDRLNRIVTDLLDLSRIEFNRDNIIFVALDLNQIAKEARQFWSVRGQQSGLELRVILSEHSPMVRANEDQINRVINNLMDNAIKNTPSGGWVEIAVVYHPGLNTARLEVRDNGRGIAPEHLAHVFERFYRVEKTTPRTGKTMGSGLGLAIARTIMEAHDGSIGAASQLGQGSTFWIELPAVVIKSQH